VHSAPGRGTTFHIYLPCAGATAKPVERRTSGGVSARGSGTVLLVEDQSAVRAVTRKILERTGYTVLAAASGAEALRLFEARGGEVNVLLTDMVMPEMSGRELASRLRERRPSLRIVFMSGYTEDALLRSGGGEGGFFLQKPFTSADLTGRLREALRGVEV
jgi:two-component system, cell cycle sensor histidine kinase and response regulator CckA